MKEQKIMKARTLAIQLVVIPWLCSCGALSENEIPMYGGVPRSPEMQKVDQKFIDNVVGEYGSREKASDAMVDL
jgi:hypothetical protein